MDTGSVSGQYPDGIPAIGHPSRH